jgi:acyl carrier protein
MKEKVKEIMCGVFGINQVNDDISQTNCDQWDSLKHLNLVVELEDAFGVSFEPEDIAAMKSLDSVMEMILRYQ